jgi:hypothetical protein
MLMVMARASKALGVQNLTRTHYFSTQGNALEVKGKAGFTSSSSSIPADELEPAPAPAPAPATGGASGLPLLVPKKFEIIYERL